MDRMVGCAHMMSMSACVVVGVPLWQTFLSPTLLCAPHHVHGPAEDDDQMVILHNALADREDPAAGHANEVQILVAPAHGNDRAQRLVVPGLVQHDVVWRVPSGGEKMKNDTRLRSGSGSRSSLKTYRRI